MNSDKIQPNSLLASFLQACKVIGVSLISPFCLQIAEFTEFPLQILDFTKRDLKKLLCNLCRHQCYIRAGKTARKDVLSPRAFLDYDVTMTAHTSLKNKTAAGLKLTTIRDSTVVGCTVTHDRAFKAGLSAHSDCRFCGGAKETMHHLACECCAIPGAHPKPLCPEYLGPNFPVLGVAEVCYDQVKNRLQCSDPHSLTLAPNTCGQMARANLSPTTGTPQVALPLLTLRTISCLKDQFFTLPCQASRVSFGLFWLRLSMLPNPFVFIVIVIAW